MLSQCLEAIRQQILSQYKKGNFRFQLQHVKSLGPANPYLQEKKKVNKLKINDFLMPIREFRSEDNHPSRIWRKGQIQRITVKINY